MGSAEVALPSIGLETESHLQRCVHIETRIAAVYSATAGSLTGATVLPVPPHANAACGAVRSVSTATPSVASVHRNYNM